MKRNAHFFLIPQEKLGNIFPREEFLVPRSFFSHIISPAISEMASCFDTGRNGGEGSLSSQIDSKVLNNLNLQISDSQSLINLLKPFIGTHPDRYRKPFENTPPYNKHLTFHPAALSLSVCLSIIHERPFGGDNLRSDGAALLTVGTRRRSSLTRRRSLSLPFPACGRACIEDCSKHASPIADGNY
ncbi:hypothetical protein CDAR_97451 [Caerostris darwini]|uniref:Maturase K n=1 Tax=Caerostris darwini TaxID=1538125 RepID=A0AAV4PQ14_9ARAC|nr:hypothetical protein CDAR_97451 [Caerostris darwini]